jgi:sec-independent protein translocase protein TatB
VFDINGGEFLVILLVAVIVVGPTRLPHYAEQLGRMTRQARRYLTEARERVGEALGEDAKDIDWEALDPRRYDPRRIVRDALMDTATGSPAGPAASRATGPAVSASTYRTSTAAAGTAAASVGSTAAAAAAADAPAPPAPFDDEAT